MATTSDRTGRPDTTVGAAPRERPAAPDVRTVAPVTPAGALDETFALATVVGLADEVTLTLTHDGVPDELDNVTPTPGVAADAAQLRWAEGPCRSAWSTGTMMTMPDLAVETRWPRWRAEAVTTGVTAVISVPLPASAGSVNFWSLSPRVYDRAGITGARSITVVVAALLTAAARHAHLEQALVTRSVIGQALGILIERHRLTPDAAFEILRASSQHHNCKLRVLADHLVATGELPDRPQDLPRF